MIIEATEMLTKGLELDLIQIQEAFDEIFSGLANDIQASAFLTALKTRDCSDDAFVCSVNSARDGIKGTMSVFGDNTSIENLTLVENKKYFDVSLTQDLICAANQLNVSRYSFLAQNDISFEILKTLGFNIENYSLDLKVDYEKSNFAYFYMSEEIPSYKYINKLKNSLPFENVLNFSSKMLNPLKIKNLFLAIEDKNLVEKYANISLKLGNDNTLVLSSGNNFPFVSLDGETKVAEAWKNKIFAYVLTPELLGVKASCLDELKCSSVEENANDILLLAQNKLVGAKYNAAILNAGLSLYISKKADSIIDGIDLAKDTINSGRMLEKYKQIKKSYNEIAF